MDRILLMKVVDPNRALMEAHYAEHADKPYFTALIERMLEGPCLVLVMQGRDVVRWIGFWVQPTLQRRSPGPFAANTQRPWSTTSYSAASATREISIWFGETAAK